jgi:hypothetical protein
MRIKEKGKVELSVENSQFVRVRDDPEDEINMVFPIDEPKENSMRVNVNKAEFVRAADPSPSISSEKDKSLFDPSEDDSTPIPLKSRHDERV